MVYQEETPVQTQDRLDRLYLFTSFGTFWCLLDELEVASSSHPIPCFSHLCYVALHCCNKTHVWD